MISNDVMWYDMMWCDILCCDVIRCDMTWCDILCCDVMWYDVIWCDVIYYAVMWYDVMGYDMIWYDVICDMIWYDITIIYFGSPSDLCDVRTGTYLYWYLPPSILNLCLISINRDEVRTLRSQIKCLQGTKNNEEQYESVEKGDVSGKSTDTESNTTAVTNISHGQNQFNNQIIALSEKHIADLSLLRKELEEKVRGGWWICPLCLISILSHSRLRFIVLRKI